MVAAAEEGAGKEHCELPCERRIGLCRTNSFPTLEALARDRKELAQVGSVPHHCVEGVRSVGKGHAGVVTVLKEFGEAAVEATRRRGEKNRKGEMCVSEEGNKTSIV